MTEHQDDKEPVIHIEITASGIKRVLIFSETAAGQAAAHVILARIQPEILRLDAALSSTAEVVVEPGDNGGKVWSPEKDNTDPVV